jgi:formamidopyrimidine-DNA glycosylase
MEDAEKLGIPPNKMPELPEVETIKNLLNTILPNRTITSIDVLREATIIGDANEFKNALEHLTFTHVSRIGKYLIFHLSNNKVFLSHLRMEGKYFKIAENRNNTKHAKIVFHLDDNEKLIYDDSRSFGKMKLSSEDKIWVEPEISKLGPEPINDVNIDILYQKACKSPLSIKQFLLDQSVLSGLGNIYVDETLFKSNLHPLTLAKDISKETYNLIVKNAKEVLLAAIESGGSTIKSYHPGENIDGNFQTKLQVYGKRYHNCPVCNAKLKFIRIGGRGTTYCPECQNKKVDKLLIGLTGKIASGKSTVLNILNKLGADIISSDEIVAKLYRNKNVAKHISKMFNLTFDKIVNKEILREYLKNNPKDIKLINNYIHPLVKEEILKYYNASKKRIVVAEVPLLFESHSEDLFDYIIGVDLNIENQIQRLQERNPLTYKELLKINSNNTFENNKKKIDYIISNNDTIDSLSLQIANIFNKLANHLN